MYVLAKQNNNNCTINRIFEDISEIMSFMSAFLNICLVYMQPEGPGFERRSCHAKDCKNGTNCLLV